VKLIVKNTGSEPIIPIKIHVQAGKESEIFELPRPLKGEILSENIIRVTLINYVEPLDR